ncbi:LacI family DNA-binding transcriptional regulator [Citricoccus sp.]|uniref:LacI family DNA-binding transcriptional regulator n=1 Tax=Citricoccus sp. TaxID=1978372 RepID=UPI0028BF3316|nr:LacI family DNA-binding transcriptional regulator [Citricoccus sp.]
MDVERDDAPAARVRLEDVARAAGVAPSTASRAFTRPDRVNFQTVERVMDAAARLGYRREPPRAAAVTPPPASRAVNLLVQDLANPFFADLLKGAVSQARSAGFLVTLGDAEESATMERTHLERLTGDANGVVAAARWTSDAELREMARRRPLVLFNREVAGISSVVAGDADSSRHLIEHLHALGHRKIVYCAGPHNAWSNVLRQKAQDEVAQALGIELITTGPFKPLIGQGAAAAALAWARRPTAIIGYNDQLAVGILRHLISNGVDVPADVSVVGYDNTYGSDFVHSGLTCVDAPVEQAGRAAVDLLLARMGGERTVHQLRLASGLQVRGSTGPASTSSSSAPVLSAARR